MLSTTLFIKKNKQNTFGSKPRFLAKLIIMIKQFMKQWFREQAFY